MQGKQQPAPEPAHETGGRPDVEPGPARLHHAPDDDPALAPHGEAPELDELNPGDGPGQTPGE
jgi:hypothetical protein